MIDPEKFYNCLIAEGIEFFCGVPDSLLKDFCAYVTANSPAENNIISVNEGAAIALASGYHIGTGKIPLVYMQNSGLGNATNPLLSLADNDVYSIPVILVIGWRGEPGVKDEPQHKKQGKVTADLLNAMGIEYTVLDEGSDYQTAISASVRYCREKSAPFAFLVRKDTFSQYKLEAKSLYEPELKREEALESVLRCLPAEAVIISTTGMLSRELFELREKRRENHDTDFLTVGSMGHTSQIAAGVAMAKPGINVFCFDGDGGALMHLGSYAFLGTRQIPNLRIIIFNNGAHDSVGGQPTIGFSVDFRNIFNSFGFKKSLTAESHGEIENAMKELLRHNGPAFLEIKVRKGARKDLGRPTQTPVRAKEDLMKFLEERC